MSSLKSLQVEPLFKAFAYALDKGQKIEDIEREYIRAALIRYKCKKSDVAKALGVSVRQLYVKIDSYQLSEYKGNIYSKFDELFKE